MGVTDVAAALIFKGESVLITRRTIGEEHAGSWEFPGGKVEFGETAEECLKRELLEEFGIEAKIKHFVADSIFDYPAGKIHLLGYCAEIVDGEIKLLVHDAFEWVNVADLLSFNLLPADLPIAMKLKEGLR